MPAISQRTLQKSNDNTAMDIMSHDISNPNGLGQPIRGSPHHQRKHSQQHSNPDGSYMPMQKVVQGSGATLNNPHMKRNMNNNTVAVKPGLGGSINDHSLMPQHIDVAHHVVRGDTPENERES